MIECKYPNVGKLWSKLPKAIRVGAQACTLNLKAFPEHERLWGTYDSDMHTITIDAATPTPERLVETVLHEIYHALWSCWYIGTKDEEDVIKLLAPAWICLIKDNPALARWLTAAIK